MNSSNSSAPGGDKTDANSMRGSGGGGNKRAREGDLCEEDFTMSKKAAKKWERVLAKFLTYSWDVFFSSFLGIASRNRDKIDEKNRLTEKEVRELQSKVVEDSHLTKEERKKIRIEIAEKKKVIKERENFHTKMLFDVAKKLRIQFVATGFLLPVHLQEKYKEEIEQYPALKETLLSLDSPGVEDLQEEDEDVSGDELDDDSRYDGGDDSGGVGGGGDSDKDDNNLSDEGLSAEEDSDDKDESGSEESSFSESDDDDEEKKPSGKGGKSKRYEHYKKRYDACKKNGDVDHGVVYCHELRRAKHGHKPLALLDAALNGGISDIYLGEDQTEEDEDNVIYITNAEESAKLIGFNSTSNPAYGKLLNSIEHYHLPDEVDWSDPSRVKMMPYQPVRHKSNPFRKDMVFAVKCRYFYPGGREQVAKMVSDGSKNIAAPKKKNRAEWRAIGW